MSPTGICVGAYRNSYPEHSGSDCKQIHFNEEFPLYFDKNCNALTSSSTEKELLLFFYKCIGKHIYLVNTLMSVFLTRTGMVRDLLCLFNLIMIS